MAKTKTAGRPADRARRAHVLEAATDWVMENGLAGLSLRPLAEGLGTSPRMLLYDFGSRDALIKAILIRTQERQAAMMKAHLSAEPSPASALRALWHWLTRPEQGPLVRLMLELRAAIIDGSLPADILDTWNEPYRALFDAFDAPEEDLVLIRACIHGLLMDRRLADPALSDKAMERFLGVIRER